MARTMANTLTKVSQSLLWAARPPRSHGEAILIDFAVLQIKFASHGVRGITSCCAYMLDMLGQFMFRACVEGGIAHLVGLPTPRGVLLPCASFSDSGGGDLQTG